MQAQGRLFAAIEAGALIRSPDCGATWQDRTAHGPRDTHQLSIRLPSFAHSQSLRRLETIACELGKRKSFQKRH